MDVHIWVLMQFPIASMSAMFAITKHGVCVGISWLVNLVNFIMADMEAVQNCISATYLSVLYIDVNDRGPPDATFLYMLDDYTS